MTRNAIVRKVKYLEKEGYVLKIKKKRPSLYISQVWYEKLKIDRIKYLDEQISKNEKTKEYYTKLKEAIDHPELWKEFHHYEIKDTMYYSQGEIVAIEFKRNGKKTTYIK